MAKGIQKPSEAAMRREVQMKALVDCAQLMSRAGLVEDTTMPLHLSAAFMSGRPELLAAVKPRAMDEKEVAHLCKLIEVLMRTNAALQAHALELERMAANVYQQQMGLIKAARRLENYAGFHVVDEGDNED